MRQLRKIANVEIQTSRALCPCPKGKPHHAILGHFSLFRKLICFLGTKNSGQESRTWISLELLLYGAVKMQLKYWSRVTLSQDCLSQQYLWTWKGSDSTTQGDRGRVWRDLLGKLGRTGVMDGANSCRAAESTRETSYLLEAVAQAVTQPAQKLLQTKSPLNEGWPQIQLPSL